MKALLHGLVIAIYIALLLLVLHLFHLIYLMKEDDWRQHEFNSAACTIINKGSMPSMDGKTSEPQINVKFTVDKKEYKALASQSLFAGDYTPAEAEQFVNSFDVNKSYACWYEDSNIAVVYFEKSNWQWPKVLETILAMVILVLLKKFLKTRLHY
jgi:hypothetical protein